MAYATLDELRSLMGITATTEDATLTVALAVAESAVNGWCGRTFSVPTQATALEFESPEGDCLSVPDIANTTGLVVKYGTGDGTFPTTVDSTLYYLEPITRVGVDGATWPYTEIELRLGGYWPAVEGPAIEVTARWGWPATPAPVKQATLILAKDIWGAKDFRSGYSTVGDLGIVRLRSNPMVEMLLKPYRHARAFLAVA